MDEQNWLATQFEEQRPHLHAVAYRMLGSRSEAEDAVQEAWLRASRSDGVGIENPGGWLTTVTARVCLNMLRSRRSRREEPVGVYMPDPIIDLEGGTDPEHDALLGDSIGLALLVVLETLSPAERLAFVLHDMFAVPFDEISPIVGRSMTATRQLASRARRRVQGGAPIPEVDLGRQREVVDAFFAAARDGDFDALVAVLDPDVILRSEGGAARPSLSAVVRGAEAVARRAQAFSGLHAHMLLARVNGAAGVVFAPRGEPFSVMGFTVAEGKIVAIDVLADPERVRSALRAADRAPNRARSAGQRVCDVDERRPRGPSR